MIALLALLVFVGAVVLDYASVAYQKSVASRRAHRAALWSCLMCGISALGVLSIVQVSPLLMIPEFLGLYLGTLLAVGRG